MSEQRSLQGLIARATAAMVAETKQNTPAVRAIACAIAAVSYGQYGYQDQLFRELQPETCSEAWLYVHANRLSTPRLLPAFATGLVKFTQLGDVVVIPKGTRLTGMTGFEYETVREQYSNEQVQVIALESGQSSNLVSGGTLTLAQALQGVDPSDIQSLGIEGGSDIEILEHWRSRVVVAFKKSDSVGRREDYQEWATSAHADVDFAWVLDNTPQLGMLQVYIGSRSNDPAVSSEVVAIVQQAFEDNRLAGCHPVAMLPQQMPLNVDIQGIEDQSVRDAVVVALQNLVMGKMGKINTVTKKPESITPTEIVLAVSAVTSGFIVRSPTLEIIIEETQIHVLGAVTWAN
ncbi:baseplate J/gp47 family protein [Vibrio furnissii]|uniref:baseplate J/gp47 family protein n=1 Tax=Vibrio furnissii TaxID=29494 RepID=UPI001558EB22|nr:baseplate J/gp47 family protein [Vibrio furnissii]